MNDEYTPTMVDLKTAWIAHNIDAAVEGLMPMSEWEVEFDRAIAAHDATVRAEQREADAQTAESKGCRITSTALPMYTGLGGHGIAALIRAASLPTETNIDRR